MEITIKQLTPELLDDYLNFFDHITFSEHPDWSDCYCFSFHFVGPDEEWKQEKNRASVIKFISEGRMKGYLAYSDGQPVGWCNVNNRLNYERLLKYYDFIDRKEKKICSVVCFTIHPDFRRKGVAQKLLEQVCADYAKLNYDYIEAYPGKGDLSTEAHYKGPIEMYERLNFGVVKEYPDYFVVRKNLKP